MAALNREDWSTLCCAPTANGRNEQDGALVRCDGLDKKSFSIETWSRSKRSGRGLTVRRRWNAAGKGEMEEISEAEDEVKADVRGLRWVEERSGEKRRDIGIGVPPSKPCKSRGSCKKSRRMLRCAEEVECETGGLKCDGQRAGGQA